jgi:hypothetical protein
MSYIKKDYLQREYLKAVPKTGVNLPINRGEYFITSRYI